MSCPVRGPEVIFAYELTPGTGVQTSSLAVVTLLGVAAALTAAACASANDRLGLAVGPPAVCAERGVSAVASTRLITRTTPRSRRPAARRPARCRRRRR